MNHGIGGRKLSRKTSHRLSLYRNLITDLLRYEKIRTTEAKAKEIQAQVEKVITLGKRGDLHARRLAAARIYDPSLLPKLFGELSERYADRTGGYTRVIKLGTRLGDRAEMAVIELVS